MARRTGSSAEVTGPRIRAAALRLFARHGYAAVSMRQIATEVGLQAGALYLYTPDKQTLLFDLLRGHMEELLAAYGTPNGSPEQRFRQFVRFHIAYNLDHADEVFLSYMELRNLDPANFAAIESLRRRYEDRLAEILREGDRRGEFRIADVRLATMAVIAMLNGVNTWYRPGGRLSREEVLEIHEAMAKGMIGAR